MPNHVYQHLLIDADEETLKLIKQKVSSPTNKFDANRIIAMPEILCHTPSSTSADPKLLKQKEENIKNFGFPTWYEWANYHWGTKWGCYDDSEWLGDNTVSFQSAWSPATKIIMALSDDFPDVSFVLKWSDEGGPCGIVNIERGIITGEENFDDNSEDGIALKMDLGVYYEEEE